MPDPLLSSRTDYDARCPRCAYNLRGIPAVECPECGFGVNAAALAEFERRRRFGRNIKIALLLELRWPAAVLLILITSCVAQLISSSGSPLWVRAFCIGPGRAIGPGTVLATLAAAFASRSDRFSSGRFRPVALALFFVLAALQAAALIAALR